MVKPDSLAQSLHPAFQPPAIGAEVQQTHGGAGMEGQRRSAAAAGQDAPVNDVRQAQQGGAPDESQVIGPHGGQFLDARLGQRHAAQLGGQALRRNGEDGR